MKCAAFVGLLFVALAGMGGIPGSLAAEKATAGPGCVAAPDDTSATDVIMEHGRALDAFFRESPVWIGGLFCLAAMLPTFFGWRIIRFTLAMVFAFAGMALTFGLLHSYGTLPAIAGAIIGFALGGFFGLWLRRLQGALYGSVALGGIAVGLILPGLGEVAALIAGSVGAVVGAFLGWRMIHYLDAILTSVAGGAMAAFTVNGIAARYIDPGNALFISVATLFLLGGAGMVYQFKTAARANTVRPAPASGKKPKRRSPRG